MSTAKFSPVEGVDGAFVVRNVLTKEQCAKLIEQSEKLGYTNETHPKYQNKFIDDKELKNRQNMRLVWEIEDVELLKTIYESLLPHLPKTLSYQIVSSFPRSHFEEEEDDKEVWILDEAATHRNINELFRFYRYDANKQFNLHFDNSFARTGRERSHLSLLIYLNDDFEGGETTFVKFSMEEPTKYFQVKPETGAALLFPHLGPKSPLHEGSKHTSEGKYKYVIRSDVIYKLKL